VINLTGTTCALNGFIAHLPANQYSHRQTMVCVCVCVYSIYTSQYFCQQKYR